MKGSNEVLLVYAGSREYHTPVKYKDLDLLVPLEDRESEFSALALAGENCSLLHTWCHKAFPHMLESRRVKKINFF